MADDKEKIKLLEEQNRLYRKQLELQAEGYSLSTSYVESLKEVLEIRSRLSTAESNLLNLNKKINKEILNQKSGFDKVADVQKQISKNGELIYKAQLLEKGLTESIGKARKEAINRAASEIGQIKAKTKLIEEELAKAEKGESIDINRVESLKKQVSSHEQVLDKMTKGLSPSEKQLLYTREQRKELQKQNIEREKQKKALENVNKSLGVAGALMKGINKIPFLGDLPGMDRVMKDVEEEVKKINALREKEGKEPLSRAEALKITFSKMGGVIKNSLTDPLVVGLFVLKQLYDIFVASDKATGDLAKNFDLSYNSANNLRSELTDIANSSNDVAVTTKGLQESMVAVGQSLGVNARLNKEDLVTFTKLREQAGYTNEELVAIQKITLATGGSLEQNSKTFLGTVAKLNAQNKLSINAKQLFKEIANVSDAIKLSVGGTVEKIAEAAFKAKQFGINLEQADRISESLLDFESSINNELSAELITGKDLNFERARLLAINGDIAGASAEILKQVGGTAEFTKMNRIQQEAIAKSVGMSREDLAKSLVDREAAAKLGAKEGQSAADRYNELVKTYGIEKANAMLGDEALERQFQQQSVQERLVQIVEKLKEVFISIAEPLMAIISPIVDVLAPVLTGISTVVGYIVSGFKTLGPVLKPILGIISGIFLAMKAEAIMSVIAGAWKSLGSIPFVGPALALAAIAGGVGFIKSQSIKDGMISPDGGLMVSGAKGTYKLDPNDSVIAGTDLNKKTASSSKSQDLSPLINEMKAMRQEQAKSNAKPTVVENSMNGTKFGTLVAMNTYKTQ